MKTAFPNLRSPVQITLYSNIPFDNTYKHHTLISSLFTFDGTSLYTGGSSVINIPKERFINRRKPDNVNEFYYPRWTKAGEFNFNYANGLVTSVTLELTPEQTNANYMKVKCVNDEYYYFITGISQVNYDTYVLSLELDVLMTYQDEFLSGVKDMPIFTNRKHCHRYTDDGIMPHSSDFKLNEDTFAGIKPIIIKDKISLDYFSSTLRTIKDVRWLYICSEGIAGSDETKSFLFKAQNINYPLCMLALPINVGKFVITDGVTTIEYRSDDIFTCINKYLVGSGVMKVAKISNYPPFNVGNATFNLSGRVLTLNVASLDPNYSGLPNLYSFNIGSNNFVVANSLGALHGDFFLSMTKGAMCIINYEDVTYGYQAINLGDFANTTKPTPLLPRYNDPKLLFKPFKKYMLNAQYSNEGLEIYPELLYSEVLTNSTTKYFSFQTITTAYIGDNNMFTYLRPYLDNLANPPFYVFDHYKYQKVGLATNVNYIMPVGTNALDVFNATQSQSFYTSKVASGISSGLAIAGGIASIGLGVASIGASGVTGGSSGVMGATMIASGATAIAGGTASMVNTIKSSGAKIEDLKNTPDSINISGSNFVSDTAIVGNTDPLPFIIVYDVNEVVKEQANDFFYNYGYQVARECYFNTELDYVDGHRKIDNDIIGRTLFNYVQTNDDLVNNINNDIPLIVKKKLSSIFNDGITLWSFFGNQEIWGGYLVPDVVNLDDYFLKHYYDNTEYNILLNA